MTKKNTEHKIPVVFLLSTGHAGGTLLNLLLGVSDEVIPIGECLLVKKLENLSEQSSLARAFWGSVLSEMKARDWNSEEVLGGNELQAGFWDDWFASIYKVSEGRILADKTPSLSLIQSIVASLPSLDPFYIHLVRDPRAVCYSYMKKQSSMLRVVYTWRQSHRAIEEFLVGKPNSVRVNYEDLSRNPTLVLEKVYSEISRHYGRNLTIDVPVDLADLKLDDPIFDNVIFAGNRMRHSQNREGRVISMDLAFRKAIPAWRWHLISMLCAAQLKKYGYAFSQSLEL